METGDDNFILFGKNSQTVLERIWHRKQNSKEMTAKSGKPIKLGLIIEGGGMRSITAAGIIVAFQKLKLNDIFDAIYATSAGAITGAYFLSKQVPYGIAIYYEFLNTEKFINLYRVPPFFNIDYLIDGLKYKKKLDTNALRMSKTVLHIGAINIETWRQEFFTNHDDTVDIFDAIKASCALPIFYNKPVVINGARYLDGGAIVPFPLEKALEDGCTDILILFTRPRLRRHYQKMIPLWFEMWQLKKYGKDFIKAFYSRDKIYEKSLEIISGCDNLSSSVNIAVIAPKTQKLTLSTINPDRLKRAYLSSYNYGLKLFNQNKT
jgi:predicted patatin/cPLA2 family phospholipase